ncbi:FGGY-family carbohydrate kinase [Planctobacterium marinum]|uniref:FGGY-family carbohydrate kinase n=1 Tax=Planctobacterium marinum TaxID=1631968 RepID=UPI001E5453A9|nr:FGGY family carbohydrate kinase [Planctobacterium marinum]MCC2606553.1 hypothetical protein [Planctobacterium marinum]
MPDNSSQHTVVIDIGKTHIKLHLLNRDFQSVFSRQMKNSVVNYGDYPGFNTEVIWQWLMDGIKAVAQEYHIAALTVTTHGATAALINRENDADGGLVFPILDYEFPGVQSDTSDYSALRPNFSEAYSPDLPAGLNLGRQLHWLKQSFPEQFSQVTDILMYPQYWVWRFTGQRYSEITSLGCHTDLWSFSRWDYSALVDKLGLRQLMPPVKPAWHECGQLLPALSQQLGLSADCRFFNGVHDSNASFLRYRLTQGDAPFTVISTGTWTILMASRTPLDKLNADKDMLANIDVTGQPVACARFMGGREFEVICEQAGSWLGEQFSNQDVAHIIQQSVFALPDFSEGSGPFGGKKGRFVGDINQISGIALATLYCALMIDYQLDMLGTQGSVFIEGAFLKNPLLCELVAQLRTEQPVFLSRDSTGTVQGAACLTHWDNAQCELGLREVHKSTLSGLTSYRTQWRALAEL